MTVGFLLPLMLCTAALVFAALVGLVWILIRPRAKRKALPGSAAARPTASSPRRGWIRWLPYFGIALVFAIWTIWAALFFLVVVWLLRLNPGPGSDYEVGENEKKTARRVYTWLLWSPFLTVPVLIMQLFNIFGQSADARVLAALTPLLLHAPLLAGLTSGNGFVFRHTQQGILLISLRAALAALAFGAGRNAEAGFWLFLLGNGALWLFSSIWGWNQVSRGDCWLMRQKGEAIRPAQSADLLTPDVHLEKSRNFMQQSRKAEAKTHALAAFRKGHRDIRLQALWVLEVLEEVEKF